MESLDYLSIRMLAEKEGCSVSLIRKRFREMEKTGQYPRGVKQVGRILINVADFEDYLYHRRGRKNEK